MQTVGEINRSNGTLLIFDYTQTLKVVGTYHRLNKDDKETLDTLIAKSDFVALEWAASQDSVLTIRVRRNSRPILNNDVLVVNRFDAKFLKTFRRRNTLNIDYANKSRPGRIIETNEMTYCRKVAQQLGKQVYLVDMPLLEMWLQLVELSWWKKMRFMIGREEPSIEAIVQTKREDYMFEQVEMHEGPLSQLTRHGLLVVGYTHAENYLHRIGNVSQPF